MSDESLAALCAVSDSSRRGSSGRQAMLIDYLLYVSIFGFALVVIALMIAVDESLYG